MNRKISLIFKLLISFIIALTVFLDSMLAYADDIFATPDKIFFYPLQFRNIIIFVAAFLIVFGLISLLTILQKRFHINYDSECHKPEKKEFIVFFTVFAILIICWLPYILSYFPGGVYPDTATSIGHARSLEYNNQQPILYALLFKLCIIIAGDINAVMLFSILQCIFMAFCFSYIVFRLYLHKVNTPVLIFITAYFALFNLIPLYVVSLWKDTLFSAVLLMYIFSLTECVLLNNRKPSVIELARMTIYMLLTMFLRNNGIYVMILSTIIIAVVFRKKLLNELKLFFSVTLSALLLTFIVQGPVFNSLGLNGPFVENLGVLQQQIAYVQYIGGEMTPDQEAFLSQVCPLDVMAMYYRPFNVDTIKWCEQYNNEFLEANKGQFLKVWAGMIKSNPKLYINSYLFSTLGYWDPFKQSTVSYVNPEMWPDLREIDRYWQKDILADATGLSFRKSLVPKLLVSSATFLFLTLILFILAANKNGKSWLAFIPALVTYLTVFLATPLAFALRYIYIIVLTLPLYVVLAYMKNNSSDTNEK